MTAVILVTLALGIGADTALFSVINGVLLQDLPYPDSRQIYLMRSVTPDGQPTGLVTPREARPIYENENHPTVEAAAIAWDQEAQIVGADGRSHLTTRYGVTDQFFEVFGPQMAVGRGFERGENPGVAVLAYSTWRDMFGSDPDIVGKVVQLDPGPSPVVGVVPQGFEFPSNAGYWWLMRLGAFFDGVRGYEAYLRLRPDRTHDGIQADLTDLGSQLGPDPTTNQPVPLVAEPLLDYVVGDLGPTVTILFGATGILLLIACINVTNLLLSRVTARSRELALREAVGAGRWRIIRQVVTEGLLLSMIGGLLGLGMALAGIRLLLWAAPGDLPRLDSVAMDGNVLLFTLGVTILVGVLVATAPAWRLARNPLRNLVNEAGRGAVIGGVRNRLFSVLVVAEVGLAVLLVIGAGLLVRSYQNLIATDLNFNPNGLLAFSMNVPGRLEVTSTPGPDGEPVFNASYAPVAAFFRELTERVAGIAGVEAVATTSSLPLKNIQYDPSPAFRIVGQTGQSSEETVQTATSRSVNPDFLPTMQIRLLAGRNFAWSDGRGTPGVAIVNETFARRFFPGQDAPGQRLRYAETQYTPGTVGFQLAERTFEEMEIVGIVEDVKYAALAEPAPPSIYLSSEQWTYRRLTVVVRYSRVHHVSTLGSRLYRA